MLDRRTYFIRERTGFFRWVSTYDILDAETEEVIGVAKEQPALPVLILRQLLFRQWLPTKVFVYSIDGSGHAADLQFSIHRVLSPFANEIRILDASGTLVRSLRNRLFTTGDGLQGRALAIIDTVGNEVGQVQGDWKNWNFQIKGNDQSLLGTVTKKWAGLGKELFTNVDHYLVYLNGTASREKSVMMLASGLAIDVLYSS